MRKTRFYKIIATLGPLGYLPAPGTWGSAAGLATAYLIFLARLTTNQSIGVAVGAVCISLFIVGKMLALERRDDDLPCIVIDEWAGMIVALAFLTPSIHILIITFLLFRFFDITKVAGVGAAELIRAPWGIVLDDVVAGIWANVIMHSLLHGLKNVTS
ncbi:phosphatidylglycerophosphatase A [Vermiphilus pyriformis]|jgi:phosphatidylglycerophosphatase A|nr:MAG: phosphatidylglycerophosphatase A [Vermiphilus pyriformis]